MVKKRFLVCISILMVIGLCMVPGTLIAGKNNPQQSQGKWWDVVPEAENPSPLYDSILYSEIAPKLREIEKTSNRVKVEVIGQSAGGRDLFLVIVSDPQALGRLGRYQAIRNTMLKDPEKAQAMIEKFGDFKVPVFVNGSIHGNEYPGTDAAIRLIETLAYDNSEEVMAILKNVILLVNVVQNPDGRVLGTRSNSMGIDLNRDFITQSQPETRATVKLINEWNPMVFLDLHDDVDPMLIEPCSPPHNPNYEYDLYIKWALYQAYAMEAELVANTDETEAIIPFRDWDYTSVGWSWDDWPPIYTPMYAMYHGAYGHTLETPHEDERGVDADYWAVWGALKFVAENRQEMVNDQVEIFKRGFLDMPQSLIPQYILDESPYDQFNELTIQEFPAAYIIPAGGDMQLSTHQPARLVDFLLQNGVEVEAAVQPFALGETVYPEGTYVVWMDQPKRGLANALLEDGMDVSEIEGIAFYSPPTAWSHPLLWGVSKAVIQEKMDIGTNIVKNAKKPEGSMQPGSAEYYGFMPTSLQAFKAANHLIRAGKSVYRAKATFDNSGDLVGAGAIIFPGVPDTVSDLVNQWHLDVFPVSELPGSAVMLKKLKIAIYDDPGTAICLDELGFEYDRLSGEDLNSGMVEQYDLFINNPPWWSWDFELNDNGRDSITSFLADGMDYIGIKEGVYAAKSAGAVDFAAGSNLSADAIVKISYDPLNTISSSFREAGYGYFLEAFWFETPPAGSVVSASIASEDFMVAGTWSGWDTGGAAGKPVIVHLDDEAQDITLIGINATFRGHPKNTFRLIGNAIFNSID